MRYFTKHNFKIADRFLDVLFIGVFATSLLLFGRAILGGPTTVEVVDNVVNEKSFIIVSTTPSNFEKKF